MKLAIFSLAALLGILIAQPAYSEEMPKHDHHHKAAAVSEPDALKVEMRKLDKAMREIVSSVATGNNAAVRNAIESLHGAMEQTQAGISSGAVKIPKNAQNIDEFIRLDKAFHHNLEVIAAASDKNDRKIMLDYTKRLLDKCVECHSRFWK